MTDNLITLYFSIHIQASPEHVYNIMTDHVTYKKWTSVFSPTSDIKGSWEENSKMYFISTDEKGEKMGMIALVDKNIPGELIILRHVGIFDGGKELYEGEYVEAWKNAFEIYRLNKSGEGTFLKCSVEVDSEEHRKMFQEVWPQGLQILKGLCEESSTIHNA